MQEIDSREIWELAAALGVGLEAQTPAGLEDGQWMDDDTRAMIAAAEKAQKTGVKPRW